MKHGNPAPDLFLHAARWMDVAREVCAVVGVCALVKVCAVVGVCAVVEDSRCGLQAARTGGMRAFAHGGGMAPPPPLEGPGTVVDDMRALPGLVAGR